MSIHIEDLTVRFKNSVTAIDHADLDIRLMGKRGTGLQQTPSLLMENSFI